MTSSWQVWWRVFVVVAIQISHNSLVRSIDDNICYREKNWPIVNIRNKSYRSFKEGRLSEVVWIYCYSMPEFVSWPCLMMTTNLVLVFGKNSIRRRGKVEFHFKSLLTHRFTFWCKFHRVWNWHQKEKFLTCALCHYYCVRYTQKGHQDEVCLVVAFSRTHV